MIVFKVLNPLNGEYLTASSVEECMGFIADSAMDLLNTYTHNAPYSIVETNEDGSQTWRNPQGVEIIDPATLRQYIVSEIPPYLNEAVADTTKEQT